MFHQDVAHSLSIYSVQSSSKCTKPKCGGSDVVLYGAESVGCELKQWQREGESTSTYGVDEAVVLASGLSTPEAYLLRRLGMSTWIS